MESKRPDLARVLRFLHSLLFELFRNVPTVDRASLCTKQVHYGANKAFHHTPTLQPFNWKFIPHDWKSYREGLLLNSNPNKRNGGRINFSCLRFCGIQWRKRLYDFWFICCSHTGLDNSLVNLSLRSEPRVLQQLTIFSGMY